MALSHQQQAGANVGPILRWLGSPGRFLLCVAAYFLLQLLLRLVTSDAVDLDESEQLLTTQHLQWGYGPQPPLYSWMVFPFVQVFGPGLFAVTLFKNLLLFGIFALTYANARLVLRDHAKSVLASVSLLFIPQIAWESQRDLTHSVLVTLMAVMTFHVLLRLNQNRSTGWYAAFGVCMGLGVLSKYSFAVFIAGLLLGAVTIPAYRSNLLNWRMALVLLCGVAVVAPHWAWAVHHNEVAMGSARKLGMAPDSPWLTSVVSGLSGMGVGLLTHVGALLGIYFLSCLRKTEGATPVERSDAVRIMGRSMAMILALLVIGCLAFEVTGFKDRWFLPLCVWLPIFVVAICSGRLSTRRVEWLSRLAFAVAVIVAVGIPTRVWFAREFDRKQRLNAPFAELTKRIRAENEPIEFFVADNHWVGGNLRHRFPDIPVLSADLLLHNEITPGARGLMVWDAGKSERPSRELERFATEHLVVDHESTRFVEAPLKFWPERQMRLGVAPCRFTIKEQADTK